MRHSYFIASLSFIILSACGESSSTKVSANDGAFAPGKWSVIVDLDQVDPNDFPRGAREDIERELARNKMIAKVPHCLKTPELTESDILALIPNDTRASGSCRLTKKRVEQGVIDFAGRCTSNQQRGRDVGAIQFSVLGDYQAEKADARLTIVLENHGGAMVGKFGSQVIAKRVGGC